MVFTRDSSDRWQIESGEPIKNYKINDLLDGINNLKVDAFISEKPSYLMPYGLANPGKKIELFAGDSKEIDLEFGNVKNDRMFVINPRTGSVVAIKTDKLKNILLKKDDVYDPTANKTDTDTNN